jgi:hypothetical protein
MSKAGHAIISPIYSQQKRLLPGFTITSRLASSRIFLQG